MTKLDISKSIIFLGLAEHIQLDGHPYPIGPVSIFNLSRQKNHFVFPVSGRAYNWVFLFHEELFEQPEKAGFFIEIKTEDGQPFGNIKIEPYCQPTSNQNKPEIKQQIKEVASIPHDLLIPKGFGWIIVNCHQIDGLIKNPANFIISASFQGQEEVIGSVNFLYQKVLPYTSEQMKAIEADPLSAKSVRIEIGCKNCPAKLRAYSQFNRSKTLEDDGFVWQYDLCEEFNCDCGQTTQPLIYLRESMHGLLGKGTKTISSKLDYLRRYAHSEIVKTVNSFNLLLDAERDEKPFQLFLEKNPVMLARFHAKKLFIKPNILGKFETDFAILDSMNQLLLIELERPMALFKKDGHPRAGLIHAYSQVRDWLHEYSKHPGAVLEGINIKPDEVMAVKGVVIAGRASKENAKHLQRHLAQPFYNDIEFLTLEDLSLSLLQISHDLA
ncbi:MAG: DUF4263 domain-containing protein [Desulfobulbaceae bacterium]|nr:DUF4263 domain-containing protein [Desulfobulbaceae bacterium]HIJ79526.1 DUF4263 domain-containing protein [Deltaproteobacteria bacterium]